VWTLPPLILVAALLAIMIRPVIAASPSRWLDVSLLACLGVVAVQLAPGPGAFAAGLSPHRTRVETALLLSPGDTTALTLDPAATAWALAIGVTYLLLWLSARALFERREGLRHVCRGIAWLGLVLAVTAFLQRALTPSHIYGFWRRADLAANVLPWGPFVNRNDFATWLLMAIPLTIGYLLMRIASNRAPDDRPVDAADVIDARLVLLAASACLMTGAILASLSRSGILSLAVALVSLVLLARRRLGAGSMAVLTTGMGVLAVAGAAYANLPALLTRLNEAWPSGLGGRLAVWAETWPIVRDFPAAGVGVGAFERAMLVYQQSNRLLFINHAHNEYLQIAAEGGLLLAVPAAAAILAAGWLAARNLRADSSAVFWARAGAIAGLIGVAFQSVWDTGLRMPANGVLFALAAAIAVHNHPRSDA
jgi:O-antigen ligase